MATYIIGDVHGCYDQLKGLLAKIAYNPSVDRVGFVGDLINRGPKSLEVLRFIRSLETDLVVLGNHDLCLLSVGFGFDNFGYSEILKDVLMAPDKLDLMHWLRQQQLMIHDKDEDFVIVHAGIPPQWSVSDALVHSKEVADIMQGDSWLQLCEHMMGNEPSSWSDELLGFDRMRYVMNALTRMRFCTKSGQLNLMEKYTSCDIPGYAPWFQLREPSVDIFFGHWATLQDSCQLNSCYGLDTGCVYGGPLTAINVATKERIGFLNES